MRRFLIALTLLAACQMTAPEGGPTGLAGDDAISVTTLDSAPPSAGAEEQDVPSLLAQEPTQSTPRPKGRPAATGQTPVSTEPAIPEQTPDPNATPAEPISPEQALCEKTGGQWAVAGKGGLHVCQKQTRDSGKICHKKGDCEGLCLARSGTCAPITPLFGCNDIFEADGRLVTLCID